METLCKRLRNSITTVAPWWIEGVATMVKLRQPAWKSGRQLDERGFKQLKGFHNLWK